MCELCEEDACMGDVCVYDDDIDLYADDEDLYQARVSVYVYTRVCAGVYVCARTTINGVVNHNNDKWTVKGSGESHRLLYYIYERNII